MISHASHASVWCLVGDSSMCWDTALDKAFENVFCILAILRFQTKNRFCESSQRLLQPRLVRWARATSLCAIASVICCGVQPGGSCVLWSSCIQQGGLAS